MEIGILYLAITALIVGLFLTYTKVGKRFTRWCIKEMCEVNIYE